MGGFGEGVGGRRLPAVAVVAAAEHAVAMPVVAAPVVAASAGGAAVAVQAAVDPAAAVASLPAARGAAEARLYPQTAQQQAVHPCLPVGAATVACAPDAAVQPSVQRPEGAERWTQ